MDPSRQSMEVRVREVRSGMHPSRFSLRPLSALFPSRSFSPRPPLDSHRRFLTHLTQMRQKGCGRLDEDSPSLNTGGMRRSATTPLPPNISDITASDVSEISAVCCPEHGDGDGGGGMDGMLCMHDDDDQTTQVAGGGNRRRPGNTNEPRVSLEGIAMRIQNGGMIQINNKDDPSPFALVGGGGRFGGRFGGRVWW